MMTAEFEDLLKRAMGLDAASVGSSAVERAVQQRLLASGLPDPAVYLDRVRGSAEELQELIEAVIVPETWFFRDREAFGALARLAFEEWLRVRPEGTLRVLSLPCSTGEEPYSAVMALRDAGFPLERLHIDAFDISHRSLAHAGRAVYGKNSFRGGDLEFRDRHFVPAGASWQLAEAVRAPVHFRPGNVLDTALGLGGEPYDVVFCRNLLIYFDRTTQDRAIATLTRLLAPKGWLFVGPSETGLLLSHNFVSAKIPLAFAFRPAGATPLEAPAPASAPLSRRATPPPARATTPARPLPFSSVVVRTTTKTVVASPAKSSVDLARATQLADQGHLDEAVHACEEYLRAHGPSAQAFHVMGLVRDASGNHAEAAELYRKALYLEPKHHEALVHLASLLESQGDKAAAKVLSARARRHEPKAVK
jgi:chemotaxis protein methyltransferase WspC